MKQRLLIGGLVLAMSLVVGTSARAHGGSGHGGGMGGGRGGGYHIDPFSGPRYSGYGNDYDSTYWYAPTPEQIAYAKRRIAQFFRAVQQGRKRVPKHRYVSVETYKPNKKQLEVYARKRKDAKKTNLKNLRCLMVFDTKTKRVVGSGCYIVSSEPKVGSVAKFESVTAEFIGQGND